jgi:hypothetical protein
MLGSCHEVGHGSFLPYPYLVTICDPIKFISISTITSGIKIVEERMYKVAKPYLLEYDAM